MERTYSEREMLLLMKGAAIVAVTEVLGKIGFSRPDLTKQEAYRIYGEANVNRWLKQRIVTKRQPGKNKHWRLDRSELELARQGDVKIKRLD